MVIVNIKLHIVILSKYKFKNDLILFPNLAQPWPAKINNKKFHINIKDGNRLSSNLRIGPHNIDIISVLRGSILWDIYL
jgi:hypothetical protein